MFTPAQVSEMLDIPTSSLRRYAQEWADHLSESARQPGKRRQYSDTDITTLQKIRDFTRQRLGHAEIAARLQLVPEPAPTPSALALVPEVIAEFQALRDTIARMEQEHSQELNQLRGELSETRRQVDELEEYLHTPWYKRIGRKRPE